MSCHSWLKANRGWGELSPLLLQNMMDILEYSNNKLQRSKFELQEWKEKEEHKKNSKNRADFWPSHLAPGGGGGQHLHLPFRAHQPLLSLLGRSNY